MRLENDGSLVDALAAFESIPADKRDYNAKLHIASCKKKLGRLLEAERDYEAIRTDPNADQPTIETAASDLDDLRTKIPKLRVAVTQSTTNVTVTIDGSGIATPSTISVNPGAHSIVARRGAKEVYRRELTVVEGTTLDVEVDAPTTDTAASSEKASPAPSRGARDVEHAPKFARSLGIVLAGVGVVAIGGGVFFAVRAGDLEDNAKTAAARGDASANALVDDARDAQLWARIGLGVGATALVGGGALILTSSSAAPRARPATTIGIAPLFLGGPGMSLQGSF